MIKLHVSDLRIELGLDVLDNILVVDSDTVWARDVTFANETDEKVTYFEIDGKPSKCGGSIQEFTNSTGLRHTAHHMIFQYDIMTDLHNTINQAWNTTTLWDASNKCYSFEFCKGRVAEYKLYSAFVRENYPQRIHFETLKNGVNFMGGSAICEKEEIKCCREKSVLLKGCHVHRISSWRKNPNNVGDMCYQRNEG